MLPARDASEIHQSSSRKLAICQIIAKCAARPACISTDIRQYSARSACHSSARIPLDLARGFFWIPNIFMHKRTTFSIDPEYFRSQPR
eukprot:4867141-Karenia_brevis.AAC.1